MLDFELELSQVFTRCAFSFGDPLLHSSVIYLPGPGEIINKEHWMQNMEVIFKKFSPRGSTVRIMIFGLDRDRWEKKYFGEQGS